ncbi:MAG: septum site-determining protein MinC [Synergistaceae bacterium]|nr:septum site-determining protein MinC [Synergistaceae bacterium]
MIQLKGTRGGLLRCVIPDDLSEKRMLEELDELVRSGRNFLEGSTVVMDMQSRQFTPALVGKIWKGFIEPSGCRVASWVVSDKETQQCIKRIGAQTGEQSASSGTERKTRSALVSKGLLYTGNLRGGQKLEHDGDVIIAGHVNTGAEVSAKGHIIVLGKLKGLVHAGAGGDNGMSVSTHSLEAGQVRIGNKVGMIDEKTDFWGKPAVITVGGDEVLLAEWPVI